MIAVAATAALALAASPVPLPGWNTTSEHAEAVDNAGRGVVVFPHGEHTWVASIAPDGSIGAVGRIEAERAVDGPGHLGAAIDDAGDVIASFAAFSGRQPLGPVEARVVLADRDGEAPFTQSRA